MKAASSSDHSIHIVIFLLSFMDFPFDRIPNLFFKVGLCVVVFMCLAGSTDRSDVALVKSDTPMPRHLLPPQTPKFLKG